MRILTILRLIAAPFYLAGLCLCWLVVFVVAFAVGDAALRPQD